MDILSQYHKQRPEALQEKKAAPILDEYGRAHTSMVGFVMRLSGGRIRDANQANIMLVIIVVISLGLSLLVLIHPGSTTRPLPSGKIIYPPGQPPRLDSTTIPEK